jgi:site-specific DNA-methyltransferase (adenine-specific)
MNIFYHGDCKFVLNHDIDPESVDLIYLDPPFFTGKVQKGTMKWQPAAMEVSYEDSKRFWSEKADEMREKSPAWLQHIAVKRPDFASYLWYMMERLSACHKVLRKAGSIYLHCDWRASHYLKMVMDEIFGNANFQNEIIWAYQIGAKSEKRWGRKHDSIFYYSRGGEYYFDVDSVRVPRKEGTHMKIEYDENGNPVQVKIDKKTGKAYRYPVHQGKLPDDVWVGIQQLNREDAERQGYPTQKPEALLERIIKASSKEGDLILDPFCGCGTAAIAASKWNRRFIGIDIHPTAFEVIKNRSHELFAQSQYIPRDLDEVLPMNPKRFEDWVNEYYKATKPHPDSGVDGITQEGIPIQVKTFQIKYDTIDKLLSSSKFHPLVPKPIKKLIFVSQTGFDDGARKRKFEIETREGIEVTLVTPEDMLRSQ